MENLELESLELDSLYLVAVMKVDQDLRGIESKSFDTLLGQTLTELGIDSVAFEDYLDSHREDLERTIEAVGI